MFQYRVSYLHLPCNPLSPPHCLLHQLLAGVGALALHPHAGRGQLLGIGHLLLEIVIARLGPLVDLLGKSGFVLIKLNCAVLFPDLLHEQIIVLL